MLSLAELSFVEIVNALPPVCARVSFPAGIQLDQGTALPSTFTTFLEKCGIKLIHSPVYYSQLNPVEKLHWVMKLVLIATCYERKADWELGLPATMLALRTPPHDTTTFRGRSLHSHLRIFRESWEGRGEHPVIVDYPIAIDCHLCTVYTGPNS